MGLVLGTEVPTNAPLMSTELDSIAAVEFTNAVSDDLGTTFSSIMLFDYPTLDSIASHLTEELETGFAENVRPISIAEEDSDRVLALGSISRLISPNVSKRIGVETRANANPVK